MARSPWTGQEPAQAPAQAPVMPAPGVTRPRAPSRAVGPTKRRGSGAVPQLAGSKKKSGSRSSTQQIAGGKLPLLGMPEIQTAEFSMSPEYDIGSSDTARAAATGLYPGVGQPGVMNRQKSIRRRV
jgi:hypothetical protein